MEARPKTDEIISPSNTTKIADLFINSTETLLMGGQVEAPDSNILFQAKNIDVNGGLSGDAISIAAQIQVKLQDQAHLKANNLQVTAINLSQSMTGAKVSASHHHSQTTWETVAPNCGVIAGGLEVHAKNTVSFDNGVPIIVTGDVEIDAYRVEQNGAVLHHSLQEDTGKFDLGITLDGHLVGGAEKTFTDMHATTHKNQEIYAAGQFKINAHEWVMKGATTHASTLTGHVDKLEMESEVDTMSGHGLAIREDSSGGMGAQHIVFHNEKIGNITSLSTHNADIEIGKVELRGAEFKVHGQDNRQMGEVWVSDISECQENKSLGFQVNARTLFPSETPHNADSLSTIGLQASGKDWRGFYDGVTEKVTHDTEFNDELLIPLFEREPHHTEAGAIKPEPIREESSFQQPRIDEHQKREENHPAHATKITNNRHSYFNQRKGSHFSLDEVLNPPSHVFEKDTNFEPSQAQAPEIKKSWRERLTSSITDHAISQLIGGAFEWDVMLPLLSS